MEILKGITTTAPRVERRRRVNITSLVTRVTAGDEAEKDKFKQALTNIDENRRQGQLLHDKQHRG
jgi:hypothetical protein